MDIVFTAFITVGLLGILVFILHKHQLSETESNADKILPLPPLDAMVEKESTPQFDTKSEKTLPPHLVVSDSRNEIKYPVTNVTAEVENANEHWSDKVSRLKKANRFAEALAACETAYPRWSAFQQAVLAHRARIKELQQLEQPIDEDLLALYRLTAIAEFLHGRVKGLPDLSLAQLKLINLDVLQNLEMPYNSIGYLELRLIKKTDIRLLLDKWGKPESHQSPRQFYSSSWLKLASSQTTLFE